MWTIGAGVVLVLALVTIVAGQWWLYAQRADDHRDAQIRDTAETAVTLVLSYDYRRLEDGMRDTKPLLTGDARTDYLEVEKPLLHSAPRIKAVVQATVKATSVLESDDDSARVLLFVDQTSTSTKLTQPQLDQSRVLVTMTKAHDTWLISTLKAI